MNRRRNRISSRSTAPSLTSAAPAAIPNFSSSAGTSSAPPTTIPKSSTRQEQKSSTLRLPEKPSLALLAHLAKPRAELPPHQPPTQIPSSNPTKLTTEQELLLAAKRYDEFNASLSPEQYQALLAKKSKKGRIHCRMDGKRTWCGQTIRSGMKVTSKLVNVTCRACRRGRTYA